MSCPGTEALKHARRSAGSDSLRPMEHDKTFCRAQTVQCNPVGQATCPAQALLGSFVAKVGNSESG